MATSFVEYTGVAAGTVTFAVTFESLLDSHIHASINGVETLSFTLSSNLQTLTFDDPEDVIADSTVRIFRVTPVTDPGRLVDWQAGTTIREADLDTSHLQNLYIAEEALDRATAAQMSADVLQDLVDAGLIVPNPSSLQWDGKGLRLTNLAAAIAATDAVRKAELDQVILDGGGLSPAQRSIVDGSPVLGGYDGPEFRQLLSVVDVGENVSDGSGFAARLKSGFGNPDKVTHFYIPQGALKSGGLFRILISGRITAEGVGSALVLMVKHNGTVFGHDDGAVSLGYSFSNATNGKANLIRWPANTRFWLDMECISLGSTADLPDRSGSLGHNMLVRGEYRIEPQSWSSGEASPEFQSNYSTRGNWNTGLGAVTEGQECLHHGVTYVCMWGHTASVSNEPSVTSQGMQYWRPKIFDYRINHMANWDHGADNEVTIELGPAYQDDTATYPAWSAGVYAPGAGVAAGGNYYVCHTATDAGDGAPTQEHDEHWERVTRRDQIIIDTAQAYFHGAGQVGVRNLSF